MFSGSNTGVQRVALAQAGLAPVLAIAAGVVAGTGAALALLYGGAVALAVSLLLVWRERKSMRHPEWDQHQLLKLFVRVGVERLILLVVLLAVGLEVLKLAPLPLMLGLLLAQLGWLAAINCNEK
ncbi:MAG: ATP synthase subunit I [Thiobacillus sp.]